MEPDTCGQHDCVANQQGLSNVKEWQRACQAFHAVRHQVRDNTSVLVVGEAQDDEVVALRQDRSADVRWSLTDNDEGDSVLPPLLRNALKRIKSASFGDIRSAGGQIQMGLVTQRVTADAAVGSVQKWISYNRRASTPTMIGSTSLGTSLKSMILIPGPVPSRRFARSCNQS